MRLPSLAVAALSLMPARPASPQPPAEWTRDQQEAVHEWHGFLAALENVSVNGIVARYLELRPRLPTYAVHSYTYGARNRLIQLGRRDEALELFARGLEVETLTDGLFANLGLLLAGRLHFLGRDAQAGGVLLRIWERPTPPRQAHDAAGLLAKIAARAGDEASRRLWLEHAAWTHPERPFCALWTEWHEERSEHARAARSFASPCLDRRHTCGLAAMAARRAYLERLGTLVLRATPLPPPPAHVRDWNPSDDPGWRRVVAKDYLCSLGRR